jgi:hypothetical protein
MQNRKGHTMSFIDMTKNYQWSEADIVNAGRAAIYSQISFDRQQELQTIMLGHIAGMRTATMEELTEIAQVQAVTEAQAVANDEARADMARLLAVMAYEAALERLTCAPITEPATVTVFDAHGGSSVIENPAIAHDAQERAEAQALIDASTQETLDLYALRHPAPVEEVTE